MDAHILDNPNWHMMCHDLAAYTTGTALAKRCDAAVLNRAAVADNSEAAFADLAALIQPGETMPLFKFPPPQAAPGFKTGDQIFSADQLVCQERMPIPVHDVTILELSPADADDMVQLVDLTKPGPFFPGLLPFRRWVGIRQNGRFVALAGERMKVPGYCEVSCVCTHPDWRGRGYGRLLSSVIADGIWERGETPFLHVDPHNHGAYRIYSALHFVKRAELFLTVLVRLGENR